MRYGTGDRYDPVPNTGCFEVLRDGSSETTRVKYVVESTQPQSTYVESVPPRRTLIEIPRPKSSRRSGDTEVIRNGITSKRIHQKGTRLKKDPRVR